jgi:2-(1,2-epoxy-1,2-dihydrophenyl)acetyl-CoA isomerase
MSSDATEYTRIVDGVLEVAISTSARGTSLDFAGVRAGTTALRVLTADFGAVLLVGKGNNFCAGGDVRAFAAASPRSRYVLDVAGELHDFLRLLAVSPAPVIAAVQGWAAGAGMSLVCAADIAVGSPATRLRPAYPGIGYTTDGGMSWTLPRIVGAARAREILLTDRVLTGEEAHDLGILGRLVPDGAVHADAAELARTLAAGPRSAYAGIKRLLNSSARTSFTDQLDLERAAIAESSDSPAGIEGVDAFLEKRAPKF